MATKRIAFDSALTVEKKLDPLGRVVIPKPLVKGYQWLPQDEIIFIPLEDNRLELHSLRILSDGDLKGFKGFSFLSNTFDDLGRLVIPVEYRRQWGIADKEKENYVTVCPGEDCVILGTATKCCFCGDRLNLIYNKGTNGVCADCAQHIFHVSELQEKIFALTAGSSHEDSHI